MSEDELEATEANAGPALPTRRRAGRRRADQLLGTGEVMVLAGMTHRELEHAVHRGWLVPIAGPRGTGNGLRFTHAEMRIARVFASLRRAGLAPEVAAEVARRVVASGAPAGHGVALVPGVDLVVIESDLMPTGTAATAPVLARLGPA